MNQPDKLKKVVLLILDGWGCAQAWGGNAIFIAKTPNYDKIWRFYPHTLIGASGQSVGLPGHERGNSEVGHLNIGTGRIPLQDSTRVNSAVIDGSFYQNEMLLSAISHCRKHSSALHLMGLLSKGNIHSSIDHLFALLELCRREGFSRVYIHSFTDGRDSNSMDALRFIEQLEQKLNDLKFGQIATISGRYWAMDRDNHWERIQKVYEAMVLGKGSTAKFALKAVSNSFSQGYTDEFIPPIVIVDKNDQPIAKVSNNDSLIFFNFRADRARQISMAFMGEGFPYFSRKKINNLFFVGMIPYGYEEELKLNLKSAFSTEQINSPIAKVLSDRNLTQLHIAETEKYAHVTYFFNGGREEPFKNEDRILVPSPRVSSYAEKPEMSVNKITEKLLGSFGKYQFTVANFANGDMVGHTGVFKASVAACEAVDVCLGKVVECAKQEKALLIVTADHGNVEQMINVKTGDPDTEHTNNPVPFVWLDFSTKADSVRLRIDGVLSDIAPTILKLMNIPQPKEMTGKSLIV